MILHKEAQNCILTRSAGSVTKPVTPEERAARGSFYSMENNLPQHQYIDAGHSGSKKPPQKIFTAQTGRRIVGEQGKVSLL